MVTSQVAQIMTAMKSMGNWELDHSGLVKFVEELAKKPLDTPPRGGGYSGNPGSGADYPE